MAGCEAHTHTQTLGTLVTVDNGQWAEAEGREGIAGEQGSRIYGSRRDEYTYSLIVIMSYVHLYPTDGRTLYNHHDHNTSLTM